MRLEGIILFLFAGASILLACGAVTLSAVFLIALSRFERLRRRQATSRSAFSRKLLRKLINTAVLDLDDVHNSYRAYFGIGTLRASHLEEIGDFLRRAKDQMAGRSCRRRLGCL